MATGNRLCAVPAASDTRVAAVYRRGKPIIPEGDTIIEADDEVFFVAAKRDIKKVISELRKLDRPVKHVINKFTAINVAGRAAPFAFATYSAVLCLAVVTRAVWKFERPLPGRAINGGLCAATDA